MNFLDLLYVVAILFMVWLAWRGTVGKKQKPLIAAPKPKANPAQKRMMGFANPGDDKISVSKRDWSSLTLALWRSRTSWEIAWRQIDEMLPRCRHATDCPGEHDETAPCLAACPDREIRMSLLVILNAARQFAPVEARRLVNTTYFAPSRELYSEVLSAWAADQEELEGLRLRHTASGKPPLQPPPNETPAGPAEREKLNPLALMAEFDRPPPETEETSEEIQ